VADRTDPDEIRRRLAEVPVWRHRINIGGVVTPGTENTAEQWRRLRLPADMSGIRVLDIGCSDGYYAFECERRGAADVLAIDDESSMLAAAGINGFRVAAELLGSSVRYEARDVEELDPAVDGPFDLVLFLNVLYHLPNPVRALRAIASVTAPDGLLVLKTYYRTDVRLWVRGRCVGFDVDRRPKWWFFPGRELAGDPTNWWAPNRRGVDALLEATGWVDRHEVARHGDRLYVHARRARAAR
jgi:tRNA (mo5U34)-methyltransferase